MKTKTPAAFDGEWLERSAQKIFLCRRCDNKSFTLRLFGAFRFLDSWIPPGKEIQSPALHRRKAFDSQKEMEPKGKLFVSGAGLSVDGFAQEGLNLGKNLTMAELIRPR